MEDALTEAVEIGWLQRQQHPTNGTLFPWGQRCSFVTASGATSLTLVNEAGVAHRQQGAEAREEKKGTFVSNGLKQRLIAFKLVAHVPPPRTPIRSAN